ncbi:substrate-binding periplasmic protein [Terasakiella sp.]|uniref:substrate-binding periplasmic protein n=1 Tax=Terasakiella sp. TaxID=2034861 RepID=UPI003AA94E0D
MKFAGCFLLLIIFLANASWADTVELACTDFPPYKIKKDTSNPDHQGIDIDIIEAAFAVDGYDVDFNFYPWKRALETARIGQIDGLCGCNFRPERNKEFIYSEKVGDISLGVFLKNDSPLAKITDLKQLSGLIVGAVRDYAPHKKLQEYEDIKVVDGNDERQLLRLLQAGRIDAIYTFRDVIYYRMAQDNNKAAIRYDELNSEPYYLCFSRNGAQSTQIIRHFNRGLQTIKTNGIYQSIWKKYR